MTLVLKAQGPGAPPALSAEPRLYRPAVGSLKGTPLFTSKLRQVLAQKMPAQATTEHFRRLLGAAGVKGDELAWSGLHELAHRPGQEMISRDAALQHLDTNMPRLHEIVLQGNETKYGRYTLPGPRKDATGYRELLIRYRHPAMEAYERLRHGNVEGLDPVGYQQKLWAARDIAAPHLYEGPHWDPHHNILAHVRFAPREAVPEPNPAAAVVGRPGKGPGEKVTHIEEIQSDWHQQGREKGYKSPAPELMTTLPEGYRVVELRGLRDTPFHRVVGPRGEEFVLQNTPEEATQAALRTLSTERLARENVEDRPPPAPFAKTWHELAFRRMLRHAAESDHAGVTWTTGDQQAERYDLSKQIGHIRYNPKTGDLHAWKKGNEFDKPDISHKVTPEQLPTVVGKEAAQRLLMQGKEAPVTITEEPSGLPYPTGGRPMKLPKTKHVVRIGGTVVAQMNTRQEAEAEAQRITSEYGVPKELSGLDLRIGGEGMRGFYDKMLVDYANKLGKPFGAQVKKTKIRGGKPGHPDERNLPSRGEDHEVHFLPLTPEWKKQLREEPQFFFSASRDEDLRKGLMLKSVPRDRIPGGLSDTKRPEDFDEEAVAEGARVEMEHTNDPAIAREIARDHLTENPAYYRKLKQVEKAEPKTLVLKVPKYRAPEFRPPPRVHEHTGEVYPEQVGVYNTMAAFSKPFQRRVVQVAQKTLGVSPAKIKAHLGSLYEAGKAHPDFERDRTWYHVAHGVARDIAERHDIAPHQAAGALAAISAGAEWGVNQRIARDVARYVQEDHPLDLSPKQHREFLRDLRTVLRTKGMRAPEVPVGTRLSRIEHPLVAAVAAQHLQRAESGKRWPVGHGYDGVAKAIRIYRGEHPRTILSGGKIRSFYNNLIDPDAEHDVTIDTHMINAAANRLLTDKKAISMATSSPKATMQGHVAAVGVKPLLADVIRELAKAHGVRPHEMQAVIWNQWLRLHPASEKRMLSRAAKLVRKAGYAPLDQAYRMEHRITPFWGEDDETEHHPKMMKSLVLKASSDPYAHHVTLTEFLPSIREKGLLPQRHRSSREPVIFVEPDEGEAGIYHEPGKTSMLRFKVPGFGSTRDGESVIHDRVPPEQIEVRHPMKGWMPLSETEKSLVLKAACQHPRPSVENVSDLNKSLYTRAYLRARATLHDFTPHATAMSGWTTWSHPEHGTVDLHLDEGHWIHTSRPGQRRIGMGLAELARHLGRPVEKAALVLKAHIKTYQRKTPSGLTTTVREHEDVRPAARPEEPRPRRKALPVSKPAPTALRPLKPSEGAIRVKDFVTLHLQEIGGGALRGLVVQTPVDAAQLLGAIKDRDRESFWTIFTDEHGRVLTHDCVSVGSLSASLVHPREVFKTARLAQARRIWLLHNHPSGQATPSDEDVTLTKLLAASGQALGIEIGGHVILGGQEASVLDAGGMSMGKIQIPETRPIEPPLQVGVQRTPEAGFDRPLNGPEAVAALGARLLDAKIPGVLACYLDQQNRINGIEFVADGELGEEVPAGRHLDAAVLRATNGALLHNAASVIFVSNVGAVSSATGVAERPVRRPVSSTLVAFERKAQDLLRQKFSITVHDVVQVNPETPSRWASLSQLGLLSKSRRLAYRMEFQGLPISIETAVGDGRHWYDPHTKERGHSTMVNPYGRFTRGTLGLDDDAVDVFIGPDDQAPMVFIVTQMKAPDFTAIDEEKILMGWRRQEDAKAAYLGHYNDDRFLGSITALPLNEFKERLKMKKYRGKRLAV